MIYDLSQAISIDDPQFLSSLKKWEDGWAIVFDGASGSSKKQFL
jgi:hypothetical protein